MSTSILYVDDEPALCRAFERALRAPGVKVITTTSATAALEIIAREKLDVVASDYRMPDANGVEVLREAKRCCPGARRLLVSGRIEGEVEVTDLAEADVDCVVLKPWSLDELRRVVRRAVELAEVSRERTHLLEVNAEKQKALAEMESRMAALSAAAYEVLRTKAGLDHDEALSELKRRGVG